MWLTPTGSVTIEHRTDKLLTDDGCSKSTIFTKLHKTKSLLIHHPFTSKSSYSLLIHYYYSLFYILWFFVTCAEHSRCDFLFLVIFIPFKIILVEIHSQEKLLVLALTNRLVIVLETSRAMLRI